ncbi:MAG TPA: WD40 repeat domain-containing protein, partial [Actinomycetota bacterium]
GRLLATGGTAAGLDINDAVLWDAGTGEETLSLRGHRGDIYSLGFSLDGTRVVTTSDYGEAIVWDVSNGEALFTVETGEGTGGASFSPDGRLLTVPGQRGSVQIVDAENGTPRSTLWAPGGPFCSPSFSPDGGRIAASGCPYLGSWQTVIWDVTTGNPLAKVRDERGSSGVMFSPDGERLAGRTDGGAAVWDAWTGLPLLTVSGHSGDVIGVAFSRDGTRLATGSKDGTARVWDAASGRELVRLSGHGGLVALVDFDPSGTRLLTGGGDGTARVWDVSPTAGAEVWAEMVASGWGATSIEYSEDGARLAMAGGGGGWVLDPATGDRLTPIGAGWSDAALDPAGARIAASGDGMEVIDLTSGAVIHTLDDDVTNVAYSPDGSTIATGLGDRDLGAGRAVLWDAASGRRIGAFGPGHPGENVEGLAFSPDGGMLGVLTDLGRLEVWRVDTAELVMEEVTAHTGFGADLAFSPDGRTLVTVGGDGGAVWSVPEGDRVRSLSRGGKLTAVSFSADGRRFATAGEDRTARIWDPETGWELLSLELPDAVMSVALSPDGTELATGHANGVVRVLALRVDDLVRIARRLSDGATTEPAPSVPDTSGPRGAFRVSIVRGDLLRQGIPRSDTGAMVGDYTLALIEGSFWLHSGEANEMTPWQTSGTYTVSGDRITFTDDRGDAWCAGNVVAARWRSRGATMWLTDVRPDIVSDCDPGLVGRQFHAVFTSHPWRIVGGAMGG